LRHPSDDGARLWVNDRLIAARTVYSSVVPELAGTFTLHAGERVNLRLEFIENTGQARIRLGDRWKR
jgi:MSHA biogenesis protein MshQ